MRLHKDLVDELIDFEEGFSGKRFTDKKHQRLKFKDYEYREDVRHYKR